VTRADRVARAFVRYRSARRWGSAERIQRYQRRALRRQLAFLRGHSPLLAERIAGTDLAALAALPVMDRASMMGDFDRLVTVPVTRDQALEFALGHEHSREFSGTLRGLSVGLSSGTSGHRGLFVVSPAERDAWVGAVLAMALPRGRALWGHRIALFLRADNSLYEAVDSRAIAFRFFDTFADLAPQVPDLAAYAPTILVGPPSVLREVARLASRAGVTVRPERVICAAEVLHDDDAAALREAFGVGVIHQLYQCTEGLLAHTCERGTLHLNEHMVLFEREDLGDGRFVPVITDLERRAQPIVRYRMGDVLVASAEPCACGSALTAIDRIEGRESDVLVGTRIGGGSTPVFADTVSRAMVLAEGFDDYTVTQRPDGSLDVALAQPAPGAADAVRRELRALFERLGCEAPEITFLDFNHDVTAKRRRVTRQGEQT